jgi:anti-sigma regulatory factor (Ser/Thr protein kinase)
VVEASGRRVFPGRPEQVALARRFVGDALGADPALRDVVSLLVSEAATNALLHSFSGRAQGTFTVGYAISRERIRVEVHDGGAPMVPRRRVHELDSVTGRGLELFDALADRWGHLGNERGRVVWFEFNLNQEAEREARAPAVRSRPSPAYPGPPSRAVDPARDGRRSPSRPRGPFARLWGQPAGSWTG